MANFNDILLDNRTPHSKTGGTLSSSGESSAKMHSNFLY